MKWRTIREETYNNLMKDTPVPLHEQVDYLVTSHIAELHDAVNNLIRAFNLGFNTQSEATNVEVQCPMCDSTVPLFTNYYSSPDLTKAQTGSYTGQCSCGQKVTVPISTPKLLP